MMAPRWLQGDNFSKHLNIYLGNTIDFNTDFHIFRTTDGIGKHIRVSLQIVLHVLEVTVTNLQLVQDKVSEKHFKF